MNPAWWIGALAVPWLLVTLWLLARAGRRAWLASDAWTPTTVVAHVFLVIGAVWLVLFWRGAGPGHFAPSTVLLAAVHFHFSGFAQQSLAAAVGRRFAGTSRPLRVVLGCVSGGAVVAIALIAAGNLRTSLVVKLVGVGLMLVCNSAFAFVEVVVARRTPKRTTRWAFTASAFALAVGAVLAGCYAIAELRADPRQSLMFMASTHGLANALGLALCAYGVLGKPLEGRHGGSDGADARGDVRDGPA